MLTASFLLWLMMTGQANFVGLQTPNEPKPGDICTITDARTVECLSHQKADTIVWATPTVGVGSRDASAEALDVPAVQETHEEEYGTSGWCNSCTDDGTFLSCTAMACDPHATHKITEWTCKDKHRVLEHDEQQPPTYWCRKVVSQ